MPSSVFVDPDQDDLVFILIDGVDDVPGRLQGNFVLGRPAAEQYSDANPGHLGMGSGWFTQRELDRACVRGAVMNLDVSSPRVLRGLVADDAPGIVILLPPD